MLKASNYLRLFAYLSADTKFKKSEIFIQADLFNYGLLITT
ncbi:hypothetical protein XCR1_1880041 [Xenorhabdus cabanillasii JM26]|uniref:Uncharacterized protein n=1 Tax=Xenorhabdus cabanillasii JM26 TaxID=1427517 RepID=W1J278_9GAMM|nr:hypothetical protein XCR1_1880041 [Xenorhabdus cabanillasii JM26]